VVGPGTVLDVIGIVALAAANRTDGPTVTGTISPSALVDQPTRTDIAALATTVDAELVCVGTRVDAVATLPGVIAAQTSITAQLHTTPPWPPRARAVILTYTTVSELATTGTALATAGAYAGTSAATALVGSSQSGSRTTGSATSSQIQTT
jgi:hypothetical protein